MTSAWPPSASAVRRLLDRLRSQTSASAAEIWGSIAPDEQAPLFFLLDVAAGLPRLRGHETLARLPAGIWPELGAVARDLVVLQRLVDAPALPAGTRFVETFSDVRAAAEQLREHQVVNIDFLLDAEGRSALESAVAGETAQRAGSWGQISPEDAPALHQALGRGLDSPAFRQLTGFDRRRHPYSLTLSLQTLDSTGIGWHRDLYWPREWVGQDVFAVFHAVGDESPEKGGAFLYYLPWHDRVYAFHRRRHQTTVLWNAAETDRRILHAVSGYHGADSRRHLVIAQCLRRD